MGHADTAGFLAELDRHRACVSQCFRDAFRIAGMGGDAPEPETAQPETAAPQLPDALAEAMQARIDALLDSHRIRSLPRASLQRLHALLPGLTQAAACSVDPPVVLQPLLILVEHIAQRSAYLALLAEYPAPLARVARVVQASPWASEYLTRYPLLLDSLIEWRSLMQAPDFRSEEHSSALQSRENLVCRLLLEK